MRFSSHRDFQRAFERALRRAGVPMAYSAGFSPHPKISYAGAASTGAASEAEYVEIGVLEVLDPDRVRLALDAALPPGLDVLEVVVAGPGQLAERLQASAWEIRLEGVDQAVAAAAVRTFLAAETVEVERMMKSGLRRFDARAAVLSLTVQERGDRSSGGPCAILHLVVRHEIPSVRPDDVLTALRLEADLVPPSPPVVTRRAQGPLDEETVSVSDPLAPDRTASETAVGT
jgi:radical SAM-linked protein